MPDGPVVIEAHAFVVKDDKGNPVASLAINQDGEPALIFAGKDRKARIAIGLTQDEECRFVMFDDEGNSRISVGFLPNGQAAIMLLGKPGMPSVGLRGGYEEGVGFIAIGGSGKIRQSMGIDGEGYPHHVIVNPDGTVAFNAVDPASEGTTKGGIIVP